MNDHADTAENICGARTLSATLCVCLHGGRCLHGRLHAPTQDCKLPFEASQLYNSETEEKIIDESQRRSKFRLIKEDSLFDICDGIIAEINRRDESDRVYALVYAHRIRAWRFLQATCGYAPPTHSYGRDDELDS